MADEKLPSIERIALIGNYPPRLCGIATFTFDVHAALRAAFPETAVDVYAMQDPGSHHQYPPAVTCTIAQDDLSDYRAAAHRINISGAQVVLIQHEYGIFGGDAGVHLLRLLDRVSAPVVVTLHTVLESPNADQRSVLDALARRASRLIVMAEKGREILQRVNGVEPSKIAVVPHGVPDRPFTDAEANKAQFDFDGRDILLTFGLLSPNKGIETVIEALPAIVSTHPNVLYVVLGATHPHLVAREGEAYRDRLIALAATRGVARNVRFIDGFLEQELLLDYLAAADIYVTPYLNEAQITSGTLSYAVALGKPVVSTPYWHATELLADGIGILAPFGDSDAFVRAINGLLDDPAGTAAMRKRAYAIGRDMIWPRLADAYISICQDAIARQPVRLKRGGRQDDTLFPPKLDGIERLTDGCGIIQHSIFAVPDRDHGYCVDDNCRALMLMHRYEGEDVSRADMLATIYASFVQHAWNGEIGRFRNFMGFDRAWLEREGSEDSFGRSLWSIGLTANEARAPDMRRWALHLFDQVAPHARDMGSLRSWAFAILGADAVLQAHPGHGLAKALVAELSSRLAGELKAARRPDWPWYEAVLSYDNARLPEAMMRAARRLGDETLLADGLATLDWLDGMQRNEEGQFRAVGTDSFKRPFAKPLPFDQQPLEAWATIDAAAYAFEISGDPRWSEMAWSAYRWYGGANDIGLPIAAPDEGDCFDGLMSDRVNLNRGAESVLAYQFACCGMMRLAEVSGHVRSARDAAGDVRYR